jgi:hypothetical protein
LAFGQGIHKVVDHNASDVDISPYCMGKVSCPDAKEVTITTDSYDCEPRIGQLGALGDRHSTTVKAVEAIAVYISGDSR